MDMFINGTEQGHCGWDCPCRPPTHHSHLHPSAHGSRPGSVPSPQSLPWALSSCTSRERNPHPTRRVSTPPDAELTDFTWEVEEGAPCDPVATP